MVKRDPFTLSIPPGTPYREIITPRPSYRLLVTFSQNKKEPLYNWFHYKEGFSRELIPSLLQELEVKEGSWVLDPFCGTGNTLLASKQLGYNALGFDVLPLTVFISNTKLQDSYDFEKLGEAIRDITKFKFGQTSLQWPESCFLNPRKAFSRYARNDLLFFKEKILQVEDEKIRNFLFLGLLSIVGEASNTKKDGGVVRIVKKRHLAPVRYLFKRRVKRMYKDIKRINPQKTVISTRATLADARELDLSQQVDVCITSPPYLNFVDYSKLYGLELALFLDDGKIDQVREKLITSFLNKKSIPEKKPIKSEILKETLEQVEKSPEVVSAYFHDMQLSLSGIYRSLRKGGRAAIVIGNNYLSDTNIDCDVILTEISQHLGFNPLAIWVANVRWCRVGGITKNRPLRESILILQK